MNGRRCLASAVVAALVTTPAAAQSPTAPVVIYLHGRIIEEQGPAAMSAEYGAYLYQAILDSLRAGGFQVLSEVRPQGTDVDQYAKRVADQVDSLLAAGVPARRIAVVGFSKGGGIAIRASARLHRADLTFVFMASCGEGEAPNLAVAGRILSVYETSDSLGRSCASLFAKALNGTVSKEDRITTGLKHGAFYQPRREWLEPVRLWIRRP